jgi:hypothetical protein
VDVDEAANRLRHLLADAGFGPVCPDLAIGWAAFQRFAAEPVDVQTTELWFEAADAEPACLDFVRMFMNYPDDGAEWGEHVTARFTAPPGVHLELGRSGTVHAADVADLPAWFVAVEASPAFRAGLGVAGWTCEVRIDGC